MEWLCLSAKSTISNGSPDSRMGHGYGIVSSGLVYPQSSNRICIPGLDAGKSKHQSVMARIASDRTFIRSACSSTCAIISTAFGHYLMRGWVDTGNPTYSDERSHSELGTLNLGCPKT
jgi:hypothetical protein